MSRKFHYPFRPLDLSVSCHVKKTPLSVSCHVKKTPLSVSCHVKKTPLSVSCHVKRTPLRRIRGPNFFFLKFLVEFGNGPSLLWTIREWSMRSVSITAQESKHYALRQMPLGNGCEELTHFSCSGIVDSEEALTLVVKAIFLYKTQTLHRSPPPVRIPSFSNSSFCPVSTIRCYLQRTTVWAHNNFLFVNLTSCTSMVTSLLNYWLVKPLAHCRGQQQGICYKGTWLQKIPLQC